MLPQTDDCTIRNEKQSKFFFLFTWYNVLSRLPTKKWNAWLVHMRVIKSLSKTKQCCHKQHNIRRTCWFGGKSPINCIFGSSPGEISREFSVNINPLRCKYEELSYAILVLELALLPAWERRVQVFALKTSQRQKAGLAMQLFDSSIMEPDQKSAFWCWETLSSASCTNLVSTINAIMHCTAYLHTFHPYQALSSISENAW